MRYDEKLVKLVLSTLTHNEPAIYKDDAYQVCRAIRLAHPDFFRKDTIDQRRYVFNDPNGLFNRTAALAEFAHNSSTTTQQPVDFVEESDEEIRDRINDTFDTLRILAKAACELKIRSLIVSGSPGTGKSFEVLQAIEEHSKKIGVGECATVLKGTISAVSLYIELYFARDGVLVLDDCDAAFADPDALNLLKAATESANKRKISYKKLSSALEERGVPNDFLFNGCVVVLTNTDLENGRGQKANHYDAIVSRAHFINAYLSTQREKLIRILTKVDSGELFKEFSQEKTENIVNFIKDNCDRFRELSLRTAVKIGELHASFPQQWEKLARSTLFVNGGRR